MSTRKLTTTRSSKNEDLCERSSEPFLTPNDVPPSDPHFKVIGVLNPAFFSVGGSRFLIVRVDEQPVNTPAKTSGSERFPIAYLDLDTSRIRITEVPLPRDYSPEQEPILPKEVRDSLGLTGPSLLLSFLSHLRLVKLNGTQFKVEDKPLLFPSDHYSRFGCEDPRVTVLARKPFLTYTAIGDAGATSWLATLDTSGDVQSRRLLLGPDHKHATVFPAPIGAYYYMMVRPLTRLYLQDTGIWLFRSPDLTHWACQGPLLLPRSGMWDSLRIGPAAPPIRVAQGWLCFYYGVDDKQTYHIGAALLDSSKPSRLLNRSGQPVLSPVRKWERIGRRADTVFACGIDPLGSDRVRLYYGAADTVVGVAELELERIFTR